MLPDTFLDPVAIASWQLHDRPDGERGDRIAVQLGDALNQSVGAVHRRLEQRRDLGSCLDRASPASRAVLILHYLDDLPLDEVAAILEIPLGTVKSRLAYGLATLRRHLEEESRATG